MLEDLFRKKKPNPIQFFHSFNFILLTHQKLSLKFTFILQCVPTSPTMFTERLTDAFVTLGTWVTAVKKVAQSLKIQSKNMV